MSALAKVKTLRGLIPVCSSCQKATQALLVGIDKLQFFTGDIIESPEIERGCRTDRMVARGN